MDEGASPLMNTFLKALTLRFIIYSHPPPSEDKFLIHLGQKLGQFWVKF
ncbi:hypothetical protein X927_03580 [Petrotoga mexicana DSM 14811]|uniref:Uncharacterized protein n=1 Tax=Petrotoga mexicana DSM 14811 TaxID=1122954 RepID=A0A2K1PBP9_9BACT|nr:hypothetical protein X927_03580 [Petrotoga mexicana DSM 14811]